MCRVDENPFLEGTSALAGLYGISAVMRDDDVMAIICMIYVIVVGIVLVFAAADRRMQALKAKYEE